MANLLVMAAAAAAALCLVAACRALRATQPMECDAPQAVPAQHKITTTQRLPAGSNCRYSPSVRLTTCTTHQGSVVGEQGRDRRTGWAKAVAFEQDMNGQCTAAPPGQGVYGADPHFQAAPGAALTTHATPRTAEGHTHQSGEAAAPAAAGPSRCPCSCATSAS